MKFNRIVLTFASIIMIISMVACGASGPAPLAAAAKDLNYTAEDLGTGYTMMQESDGVEALGVDASAPINSANMRAFATEDMQIVTSVVMNVKTVKDAEDAFGEKGLVGSITGQLESSIPGVQFKELTSYKFGDKTLMFAGEDATMGKLYLVVFRKVNIVSVVFIIGSNQTEESAVEIVKKLEAKIK
ncbi:MAG TPA: hypothetical protein PKW33_07215 [Anaerolineaceae bacterium]|nr:hypothetical protein [Anaerolineaceae bacterium]HPN51360.1 hypothetical protein [Anaerolineaceae bacterium]